jgi:hypothetical protein
MDHFPPPSRPASFRLRHLVRLRSTPNRWPYSRGGLRRRAGCLRLERGRRSGRLGGLDWSFRCAVRRRPSVWQPSLGVGGNCRRTCLRRRSRRLVAAVRPFGDCHGRAGRNMRDLLLQRTSHWTTRRLYVRFGRRYRNRPSNPASGLVARSIARPRRRWLLHGRTRSGRPDGYAPSRAHSRGFRGNSGRPFPEIGRRPQRRRSAARSRG